ncbi:MAG: tripartite tricarboxylate transporter substrate binding protein [Acidovorax sp.]
MNKRRRHYALAALAGLALAHTAWAQDTASYPNKPVTLVVPTTPGGGTDIAARLFADELGKAMKQSFVVDNRAGASAIIGTDFVAKSPPDGYRLLFGFSAPIVMNPALFKKLPYDPMKDLVPVAQIGQGGLVLLARKDLPANTLKEFIAYAKAHSGQLNYCSWGAGSGGQLTMESLKKQAGITMTHVPYKGASPCAQDVTGGQIDAAFIDALAAQKALLTGRVKALAYSGGERIPYMPDVPTLTELGYPFKNYSWFGVFAPAKTPPAIVKRLNDEINRAQKDPAVVKRLEALGFTDLPKKTPEQFNATIQQDLRDWTALIKSVGVTLD